MDFDFLREMASRSYPAVQSLRQTNGSDCDGDGTRMKIMSLLYIVIIYMMSIMALSKGEKYKDPSATWSLKFGNGVIRHERG